MKFLEGVGCLASNKPIDFGADPDCNPDPGFLNGIFTTPYIGRLDRSPVQFWLIDLENNNLWISDCFLIFSSSYVYQNMSASFAASILKVP